MMRLALGLCLFAPLIAVAASGYCFHEAAQRYQVSPQLLVSIAEAESSFRAHAINKNRNGSEDLGVMQINSAHLPYLHQFGITRQALLSDPCLNIHIGAWVLANAIRSFGMQWEAVGAYNAGGKPAARQARLRYARRIADFYRRRYLSVVKPVQEAAR